MSRPAGAPEDVRHPRPIRFSAREFAIVTKAADSNGRTPSAFIRAAALAAAGSRRGPTKK